MGSFKAELRTAVLFTLATTVVFGIAYPLVVTVLAQALFPEEANGSLVRDQGTIVGSRLLGQPFTGRAYFHPRPSAAGPDGFDPTASGPSNLGPTNRKLVERVAQDVAAAQKEAPGSPVPIDLVTTSGSGLDPHITPLAAAYQAARVAQERQLTLDEVQRLVELHTEGRQWGLLGEPRVNVLELNLDLDRLRPVRP